MEFTVRIRLGNSAMLTGQDVAEALVMKVVPDIIRLGEPEPHLRPVTDANGAIVGEWGFRES